MSSPIQIHGYNRGYLLDLYDTYQTNPDALPDSVREMFDHWTPNELLAGTEIPRAGAATQDTRAVVGAVNLAQAIRQFGHLAAQIRPIGEPPSGDEELKAEFHGITDDDLRNLPADIIVSNTLAYDVSNALEATNALREIYCSTIGYDNEHITNPTERKWLREKIESRAFRFEGTDDEARDLLYRLTEVETMEHFLQRTFATKYRFSIEGLDMMVPMLDVIKDNAADSTVETMMVAMAHRGRLNVLAHIMGVPYKNILVDFSDTLEHAREVEAIGKTIDDVKYHKGATNKVGNLTVRMPSNPSHLEQVNPVAQGIARAAGTDHDQPGYGQFHDHKTVQVLIHGDAAFMGQGITAETFNMSRLPGYTTGGTIHVIANNQLGFTTLPESGRSTRYASDLAKGFRAPIVHVNADDPAACIEVARLAYAYQQKFESDFLIDLNGYRRHGHNELDQPGVTQPMMYKEIDSHPTVRSLWAERLLQNGDISEDDAQAMVDEITNEWQRIYDEMQADDEGIADPNPPQPEPGIAGEQHTAVDDTLLRAINDELQSVYGKVNLYPNRRWQKSLEARRDLGETPDDEVIDWPTAEEFAFATILAEGTPIRLTGQDSQRGTFAQRHAVLHDSETGEEYVPLHRFNQAKASFDIYNSPLSEAAVVAFEYGYNLHQKEVLVLWEAQFGDFVNGAQTIIDEFVATAREKWGETSSLVMLLPHGAEGAGPDHSTGRLERFLQLCARKNMRVVNPTTPAQYFHVLRRQAKLLVDDPLPLIMMTPKSNFIRSGHLVSSLRDLTEGRWQPVIDDSAVQPDDVTRLVFCSGKFYYDLASSKYREHYPHVALVRLEQLYPYPAKELDTILQRYSNTTQIVWAQEEPKNMGAWEFVQYRLKKMVGMDIPVNYVGRRRNANPAEGSKTAWSRNQSLITRYTFDWDFDEERSIPQHPTDDEDEDTRDEVEASRS